MPDEDSEDGAHQPSATPEKPHHRLILHGKAAPEREVRDAVESLRKEGHRIGVRVTWEAGDARRMAREAKADGVVIPAVLDRRRPRR